MLNGHGDGKLTNQPTQDFQKDFGRRRTYMLDIFELRGLFHSLR